MGTQRTVLLVDGDIVACTVAHKKSAGEPIGLDSAKAEIDRHIRWLGNKLNGEVRIYLSGAANFRYQVFPAYKANRPPKNHLVGPLKDYLKTAYSAVSEPTLEADDLMGILATEPTDERRVIVSIDKDMRQIPALLFNPLHSEEGIRRVTREDGDRWFYTQVITGDQGDGYYGIPGMGPSAAEKILQEYWPNPWPAIVKEYEFRLGDAQFGARYALMQARCARILRNGEYDWVTGSPLLWTPAA